MALDNELAAVLRECLQFLESLNNVNLPDPLQSARRDLLAKFKAKLPSYSRESSCSPEAYLDMSASRGLLVESLEVEEYVGHDPPTNQLPNPGPIHVDYYETFQDVPIIPRLISSMETRDVNDAEDDHLVEVYGQFTVAQTRSQCRKCSVLHVRKKVLFLEPLKPCFVGLVGAHLLIYDNDKDSRPSYVIPLRGYQARPMSKNQKQSENAFEIYRPGYRTLKFVATDVKEMSEWIEAISDMVKYENEKEKEKARLSSDQLNSQRNSVNSITNERYQDVGPLNPDPCKSSKEVTSEESSLKSLNLDIAPPLPNRTTRKLPKLPEEATRKCSTCEENYDEDDIYHKIEDFSKERYQNCMVLQKVQEQNRNYDDVETQAESVVIGETYDDISSIMPCPIQQAGNGLASYDEIKASELRDKGAKKNQAKKLQHKRSFLDRVRRKTQKSIIVEVEKPECCNVASRGENGAPEEQIMYLVPPKPRPVIIPPEELYDDIESCRKMMQSEEKRLKSNTKNNSLENILHSQESILKVVENLDVNDMTKAKTVFEEGLYDDIAILTDFKNRQRRRSTASIPERRVWSRFSSGRVKIFDFSGSIELLKPDATEPEEPLEPVAAKVTSFKRLINKVENSLGKSPKPSIKIA